MPNHVTNIIELHAEPEVVAEVFAAIQDNNIGPGSIDFNKLIPMPESLSIESGSRTDAGLKVYKQFLETCMKDHAELDPLMIPKERETAYLAAHPEIKPDEWELGRTAYRNTILYGDPTWYGWSIANWGTKWNAYDQENAAEHGLENTLIFLTAWSAPHPVLEALAEKYPELSFTHSWADEDIGNNCGRREYASGICVSEYIPDTDKEGIELAASIMDADPSDWGLTLNAVQTGYVYLWDNSFHEIEALGRPILFSKEFISNEDVPKGMFSYRLCKNEDGYCLANSKRSLLTSGSVVTDKPINVKDGEPLPLGCDPYALATPENRTSFGRFLEERQQEAPEHKQKDDREAR